MRHLSLIVLEPRDVPAGLYLAAGDVLASNPGPEIVTGDGVGGGPRVRVLRPSDGQVLLTFFAYEPTFTGGVQVAVGDVTGDGRADIVAGTGVGGGPRVRVFAGGTLDQDAVPTAVSDFFVYEETFRGGVQVAAADTDGDGRAELVTGTGVSGGPRVKVLKLASAGQTVVSDFFAYEASFRGGVLVAGGDLDGDGVAELVTGTGPGGGPAVRTYAVGGTLRDSFFAFDSSFRGGVYVAAGDTDGDGKAELLAAPTSGGPAEVRAFDPTGATRLGTVPVSGADGLRLAAAPTTSGGVADLVIARANGSFDELPTVVKGVRGGGLPSPPVVPPPPPASPPPVSPPAPSRTFEDADWVYYLPAGLEAGKTYPIVFTFSPGRNPADYDPLLRPVADQYKWIIAGSKFYSNTSDSNPRPDMNLSMSRGSDGTIESAGSGYATIRDQINAALGKVPADASRVILSGISGGGSVSHALSLLYPGLADGLIISTGMIWGDQVPAESSPNGPYWNRYLRDNAAALADAFRRGGSRRVAVFLEGSTDFRLEEMQRDAPLLRAAGWTVQEIRFEVGHAAIPADGYKQAAAVFAGQASWTA